MEGLHPQNLEQEISDLNAQLLRYEEALQAAEVEKNALIESAAVRERDLQSAANATINQIFSAIPIRSGALESGRFVIRPQSIGAVLNAAPPSPEPPATPPLPKPRTSIFKRASLSSSSSTATPLPMPSPVSPTTSKMDDSEATGRGKSAVRGLIRFKSTYVEKPKVFAWIQMSGSNTAIERLPGDTLRVSQSGFTFQIDHDDPQALVGSVINWFTYSAPPMNQLLMSTIQAIQAHTQPTTLPSELEKAVTKFLHHEEHAIHEMDINGQTLLHVAAYAGNTKLIKLLLSKGAAINAVDEHGWTALLCAVSPGHFEAAMHLIKAGADCAVASESENTPLHYLARLQQGGEEYLSLVRALIKGGCDPNQHNIDGDTALTCMCSRNPNNVEAVEALIKGGCNPNSLNKAGVSALHIAVLVDGMPLLTKLLELGADPELQSPNFGTPGALATSNKKTAIAALLAEAVKKKKEALGPAAAPKSSHAGGAAGPRNLQLEVFEARDVSSSPHDVYCLLVCGKEERRTNIAFQTTCPRWGETFKLTATDDPVLQIDLFSWHLSKSAMSLGHALVPIDDLSADVVDQWFPLISKTSSKKAGQVHIRIQRADSDQSSGGGCGGPIRFALQYNGKTAELFRSPNDNFTSVILPREEWIGYIIPPGQLAAVAWSIDAACLGEGMHIEVNKGCVTHKHPLPIDFDYTDSVTHYSKYFTTLPHSTVYGLDDNQPLVFSVQDANPTGKRMAIMRSKKETIRLLLPNSKNEITAIKDTLRLFPNVKFSTSHSAAAQDSLLRFEKLTTVTRLKFGLLYAAPGQTSEREMFNNLHTSPAFEEFLDWIGTRTVLRGFTGYTGGLDTKADNTGTHSIFTTFGDEQDKDSKIQIMFHVATMLPYQVEDEQKVERKRHIGNDVVVMVFKESEEPEDSLNLTTFVSHFNHVFIVVSPVLPANGTGSVTEYRVSVACKTSVKPFPPFFPTDTNVFKKDDTLRTWLLKKLINAERTAMEAPDFRGSMMSTRKTMLMGVIDAACSKK